MHQNMVMNELPILVLVEIYQISGKDKSENTFINMSVLPEENNANRKKLGNQEIIPNFAVETISPRCGRSLLNNYESIIPAKA